VESPVADAIRGIDIQQRVDNIAMNAIKKSIVNNFPVEIRCPINILGEVGKRGRRRTGINRLINANTPVAAKITNHQNQIDRGFVWVLPSSTDPLFSRHDLSLRNPVADAINGIGIQRRVDNIAMNAIKKSIVNNFPVEIRCPINILGEVGKRERR